MGHQPTELEKFQAERIKALEIENSRLREEVERYQLATPASTRDIVVRDFEIVSDPAFLNPMPEHLRGRA